MWHLYGLWAYSSSHLTLKSLYPLLSVYVTPAAVTCLPVQLFISEQHVCQTLTLLRPHYPWVHKVLPCVSPSPVPLGTSTVRILVLATWQLHLPSICLSLLLSLTSLRCFLRDERSSMWAVLSQPKTANIWLKVRCNLVNRRQRIYFYLKASYHAPIIFVVLQNILYLAIGSWDICNGIECYMIQYSLLLVMSLPVCGRQEWREQCVHVKCVVCTGYSLPRYYLE